jgi:acetyl esterase
VTAAWILERGRVLGDCWFSDLEPAAARDAYERITKAHRSHSLVRPEVGGVVNETLRLSTGPVRVRIYQPEHQTPAPVVVYFHGGGFVFGSINSFDEVTRLICRTSNVLVVAVDYPLAPDQQFPAPLTACVESVEWVRQHIAGYGGDPNRVLVMGDSAGGNLAAATALECRERGVDLIGQVVMYGTLVHVDLVGEAGVPDWADRDQTYGPTVDATRWYWTNYAQTAERARNPRASVLLETDLTGLPPALITAGSLDSYRADALAYSERLRAANVDVDVRIYSGAAHGYIAHGWWPADDRSEAAFDAAMDTLARVERLAHR